MPHASMKRSTSSFHMLVVWVSASLVLLRPLSTCIGSINSELAMLSSSSGNGGTPAGSEVRALEELRDDSRLLMVCLTVVLLLAGGVDGEGKGAGNARDVRVFGSLISDVALGLFDSGFVCSGVVVSDIEGFLISLSSPGGAFGGEGTSSA